MTLAGAATGRNASSTLTPLQRGLEIVDVALELGLPGIFDRARRRPASIVVATPSRGVELGVEFGEIARGRRRA